MTEPTATYTAAALRDAFARAADGYRDVINRIGKTWDAAFDANTFDVREF